MEVSKKRNAGSGKPKKTNTFFEDWRFKAGDAEPDKMRFELIDETPKEVMVSVAMLTYNHEEFIKEALDSILMQKRNFSLKVVIADDCSTDNTREIVLEYQEKYPEIFKLVFQKKNLGISKTIWTSTETSKGNTSPCWKAMIIGPIRTSSKSKSIFWKRIQITASAVTIIRFRSLKPVKFL